MNIYQSIIAANSTANMAQPASKNTQQVSNNVNDKVPAVNTGLPTNPVFKRGNSESFSKAEQYFQQKHSSHDQPSEKNQKIIEHYNALDREDKRAEVQKLMGVDTFA